MIQTIGGLVYQTVPLAAIKSTDANHQGAIHSICNASATGFGLPFLPDVQLSNASSWDEQSWRRSSFNESFLDVLTFYAAQNLTILLGDNIR
jgi:hypothetical protein